MTPYNSLLLITLSSLLIFAVAGRVITTTSPLNPISDGVNNGPGTILRLNDPLIISSDVDDTVASCKHTYGFIPCSNGFFLSLCLLFLYSYVIQVASSNLSDGSELLLHVLGPGVVGGLFLPIFGSVPEAMIILASGLAGSVEVAQGQVSIGMGLLAGSIVMLLTLIWGACVTSGKSDLEDSVAIDNQDTKASNDLTGSGVSTDIWTSYSAMIMVVSVIPLIVLQFPQIIHSTTGVQISVLVGLIFSVTLLVAYCVYQVIQPKWQKRRLVYTKYKHVRSRILMELSSRSLGRLLDDQGQPNLDVMTRLFNDVDVNGNKHLSQSELRALVVGLKLQDLNLDEDDAIDKVMSEFDMSNNNEIEFDEFTVGLQKWLKQAKGSKHGLYSPGPETMKYVHDYFEETLKEQYLIGDEDDNEEGGVDDPKKTSRRAVILLIVGILITLVVAKPLVDAIDNFSMATSIPSFFLSFVWLPWSTNSAEATIAMRFASRKTRRSTSLTFSELYGTVTMNIVLCLSVFLALVYVRGLTWDFSSEVLVIAIVCIVIGIFGSLRTTYPLWTASVAFALYPFSLVLVYVFGHVFGWS
ncbi:hypothetical protein LXL04_037709 [Taraxacum kok-saghyz]